MRKISIIVLTIVSLSVVVYCQAYKKQEAGTFGSLRFGVTAGVNFATFTGDESDVFSRKTDFVLGVTLENYKDPLGINFGLLYFRKGAIAKYSFNGVSTDATMNFDVIEVPVYLRYIFPFNGPIKPFVTLGSYMSLTISGTQSISGEDTQDILSHDAYDAGVLFGFGGLMELSKTNFLTLQVRWEQGFWDVDTDIQNKHNAISILSSISF
ncbi:MAG: PorT family protein [Ignavibacteria bacterium]|nr:PorT family protein [Ignavibacteria bacterium]